MIEGNFFDGLRGVTGGIDNVQHSVVSGTLDSFTGFFNSWKYTIIFFIIFIAGVIIFAAWMGSSSSPQQLPQQIPQQLSQQFLKQISKFKIPKF